MEPKAIVLIINGIEYQVKTIITLASLRIFLSEEDEDYEERVAKAILHAIQLEKTEDKPSVKEVLEAGDRIFQQYIDVVVSSNEINSYYLRRPDEETLCERFCKALEDYIRESLAEISKGVAHVLSQTYQPFGETIKALGTMVTKTCEPALAITKKFADVIEKAGLITASINQSIAPVMESIAKAQESFLLDIEKYAKAWNEVDWIELEGSYRIWGEYGWTLIDDAPFSFFSNPPQSEIDADKMALQFFSRNEIKVLLCDLRKIKIHINDLESAIFCFDNRQYKACAMLLCSIIEAQFIKMQPKDIKRRKVGKRAVERFNDETVSTASLEKSKLIYLHTTNVLSFLSVLFADANDFRSEPKNLNRNFIDHGMAKRDVRRKDCVKLFLGLYNTMEMLEFYNSMKI